MTISETTTEQFYDVFCFNGKKANNVTISVSKGDETVDFDASKILSPVGTQNHPFVLFYNSSNDCCVNCTFSDTVTISITKYLIDHYDTFDTILCGRISVEKKQMYVMTVTQFFVIDLDMSEDGSQITQLTCTSCSQRIGADTKSSGNKIMLPMTTLQDILVDNLTEVTKRHSDSLKPTKGRGRRSTPKTEQLRSCSASPSPSENLYDQLMNVQDDQDSDRQDSIVQDEPTSCEKGAQSLPTKSKKGTGQRLSDFVKSLTEAVLTQDGEEWKIVGKATGKGKKASSKQASHDTSEEEKSIISSTQVNKSKGNKKILSKKVAAKKVSIKKNVPSIVEMFESSEECASKKKETDSDDNIPMRTGVKKIASPKDSDHDLSDSDDVMAKKLLEKENDTVDSDDSDLGRGLFSEPILSDSDQNDNDSKEYSMSPKHRFSDDDTQDDSEQSYSHSDSYKSKDDLSSISHTSYDSKNLHKYKSEQDDSNDFPSPRKGRCKSPKLDSKTKSTRQPSPDSDIEKDDPTEQPSKKIISENLQITSTQQSKVEEIKKSLIEIEQHDTSNFDILITEITKHLNEFGGFYITKRHIYNTGNSYQLIMDHYLRSNTSIQVLSTSDGLCIYKM